MEIIPMLISLVTGAIGGNAAGAATPDKSLGTVGNSLAGLFGGGIGGGILQALDLFHTGGGNLGVGGVLSNIAASGVGGAILTWIIGFIKDYMDKKKAS
jgi:uncharacterized membrane protein YeaQ/YmgE (transglycosylase-associated protein family)